MTKFKLSILSLTAAAAIFSGCSKTDYDLCIYGGTASGVIAAASASRLGMDVVLVEPGSHIGGMTTGGLGYTDIGNKQVVTGLAKKFYRNVGEHYGRLEQWIFEPHVASEILDSYLEHPKITVLKQHRLENVTKSGKRITDITVSHGPGFATESDIAAKYFIDCSYEGDLMAKAGVSYIVGREGNDVYGETIDGVQLMNGHQFPDGIDPFVEPGNPDSGLLWGISPAAKAPDGTGDTLVQAYNYRICLTDSLQNMIPITRPENYDSSKYELLLRLMDARKDKTPKLGDYFIWSRMPGRKTDINNKGGFSTDMIGMNHRYPEAGYELREEITDAHKSYTIGLLYFMGHDERVPEEIRKEMLRWGYPKDEFVDNGHWTPQLYVREARRMTGEYVATQADCEGRTIPEDGVAMAAYTMDSHNCQRIIVETNGQTMVKNEGNVEVGGNGPYPVSYRSITPKRSECTNLLVPVCLSASHIAYGSIRMEPVFMVLGQVSAMAAWLAAGNGNTDVQNVDYREINSMMAENPYLDGSTPDIIVDDLNAGVSFSDDWTRVRRGTGYGPTYLKSKTGKGTAEFNARISETGNYSLYCFMHKDSRPEQETHMEITSSGETWTAVVEHDRLSFMGQTKGEWVMIGTFGFKAGENPCVKISGQGGKVRADAILFVRE